MTNQQRQHLLAYLGYYVGTVDGDWGTLSRTACTSFQQDFGGIRVDGFGGPETDKALRHAVAYDMFKPEPVPEQGAATEDSPATGTFWDEIEFFTPAEFACKCGCGTGEMEETEVRIVDEIRRRLGVPITINSGLRCPTHNANEGGVWNSLHLTSTGKAADLHSAASPARMKQVAEEVMAEMLPGRGGIGLYSWGIHVDTGKYSRWNG